MDEARPSLQEEVMTLIRERMAENENVARAFGEGQAGSDLKVEMSGSIQDAVDVLAVYVSALKDAVGLLAFAIDKINADA